MWLCAVILRVTIDLSNLLQRMKKITFGLLSLNINRFLSIQHWYVCWFIKIWHVILWSTRLCFQTSNQLSPMNKSTALVWSPLLYVQKNTTRSLHPLGFYAVLCLLLMSFVITEIGVRRWAKVSKPSTHEKGLFWSARQRFRERPKACFDSRNKRFYPSWRREVLRFEDAEIQYPNIPNEWEQRKRDKPLPDIPWNTDWLFNKDPYSDSCLIPIWLGCTIPYIQQITRVFSHCSLDKRWKLAKGVALPQDSEMFQLKYCWIMDLNGVSSWWFVHQAIWKICASQIGSVCQGWN